MLGKRYEYTKFKRIVGRRCQFVCEVPGCSEKADTVHHFMKASTWPEFKYDPENGMGVCGPHHAQIEENFRQLVFPQSLYPMERYYAILRKTAGRGRL